MTTQSVVPEVLHLSSMELNLRSRAVRRDLSDLWKMRRTLLHAFESENSTAPNEGLKNAGRLLFRVDQDNDRGALPRLLVQHYAEANWKRLPDDYFITQPRQRSDLLDRLNFPAGTALRFRLRANPVKSQPAPRDSDGRAPRGKRVALLKPEAQLQWLRNQFRQKDHDTAAVALQGVKVIPEGWCHYRRSKDTKSTCHIVLFEGILIVQNSEALQNIVSAGIGPAKGFGCGLLSLAPA